MIRRVQRYVDNLGALNGVLLLGFVGFVTWRMSQVTSTPGMVVFGVVSVFLLVLPLVVMPFFVARPQLAFRCIRVVQFVIYGYIGLLITNIVPIPMAVVIGMLVVIYLHVGFGFWFFSSPRIVTCDGERKWVERVEKNEEARLVREIAQFDRDQEKDSDGR